MAFGVWIPAAVRLVPALIESMYRQESLTVLNGLITGQGEHPIEFYLNAWARARLPLTGALAGALVPGAMIVRFRAPILHQLHRLLRTGPTTGIVGILSICALWGWIGGGTEGVIRLTYQLGKPSGFPAEYVWLAPLAGTLTGMILGTLVWICSGARPISTRTVLASAIAYAGFTAVREIPFGVHPVAALVLALGVAVEFSRRFPLTERGLVRAGRIAVVLSGLAILAGIGMGGVERLTERRDLAAVPDGEDRPNIILLILDTVRAKSLPMYGYARNTMPLLAERFRAGVTFERAVAPSPWTGPSHATLFTGTWPWEHEVSWGRPLGSDAQTLAELLTEKGYSSVAFMANPHFTQRRSGFDRGFQVYRDNPVGLEQFLWSHRGSRTAYGVWRKIRGKRNIRPGNKDGFEQNAELAEWMDDDLPDSPLFLTLNYIDAHQPYDQPAPYNTTFRSPAPRSDLPQWIAHQTNQAASDVEEMRDAYDHGLVYLDAILDDLFQRLEEHGILDDAILVVLSDHGEQFGEHGLAEHSNSLYSPVLHVPMLIAGSGVPAGRTVDRAVSLRDVGATVLDLIGESTPTFPGTSLRPLWEDRVETSIANGADTVSWARTAPVYAAVGEAPWGVSPVVVGRMLSVTEGAVHFIRNGDGAVEAYDWASDPEELDDVTGRSGWHDTLMRLDADLRSIAEAGADESDRAEGTGSADGHAPGAGSD